MYQSRLKEIISLSVNSLYKKINGGVIVVENEASLQLQLASILKSIGEFYLYEQNERFLIELEKPVTLADGYFPKSGSGKAKIDIYISIENIISKAVSRCAMELKFFKKSNHREPNNRYDVFRDLSNIEKYTEVADFGYLLVATDHEHYISQKSYSLNTSDFDFRNGEQYRAGKQLVYNTSEPYGEPIILNYNYNFKWLKCCPNVGFMNLEIEL